MAAESTLVEVADLPALLAEIRDPDRQMPIVLVSVAHETDLPRVPLEDLTEAVRGLATVTVLATREVSDAWRHTTPPDLHAYNGVIRVCAPGSWRRRPIFFVTWRTTDPAETIARVVDRVQPPAPDLTRAGGDPAWAQVRKAAGQLADDADTSPEGELSATDVAQTARTIEAIAEEPGDNTADLQQELDETLTLVDELFDELVQLTEDRDGWKALALGQTIFDDPEEQFRWQIQAEWSSWQEADRQQYPLRDYCLGPNWLDSVATLQGISHDRIVEVTVQVVTGRAWTINAREAHQLRTGEGGDNPPVVRPKDQATAWRCYLQTKTPAARRLMWWQLPDGGVELGRVTTHDDYGLR